jgi:DNA anti-recombination protein RmuC
VSRKTTSKGDLQKSQVAYLEKLSKDFADSTKNQKTHLQEKTSSAELSNLKVLLEMGVITKDEFTEQANAVVGLKRLSAYHAFALKREHGLKIYSSPNPVSSQP